MQNMFTVLLVLVLLALFVYGFVLDRRLSKKRLVSALMKAETAFHYHNHFKEAGLLELTKRLPPLPTNMQPDHPERLRLTFPHN